MNILLHMHIIMLLHFGVKDATVDCTRLGDRALGGVLSERLDTTISRARDAWRQVPPGITGTSVTRRWRISSVICQEDGAFVRFADLSAPNV